MSWNLPHGVTDAMIDRVMGGVSDPLSELNSWHAKHQKIIDDECDRRQAELDAWWAKATAELEAEYRAEKDKLSAELDPDRLLEDRYDWDHDR